LNCREAPPRLNPSKVTKDGDAIKVDTDNTLFPEPTEGPFRVPPGTNFLPTIYTDMCDASSKPGKPMPNTLPSTLAIPYNLHDGEQVVTQIDKTSPPDDLESVLALLVFIVCQSPSTAATQPEACADNNRLVKTRWEALGKLNKELGLNPTDPLLPQL